MKDERCLETVGQSVAKVGVREKAVGKAVYVADMERPGMLWAHLVRSPHPHAVIKRVNVEEARGMPGVVGVFTSEDVPGQNLVGGRGTVDQPVLAAGKVRLVGEPVAMVVAETKVQALQAAATVEVEYEVLPGVFTPQEALEDGSPKLFEHGNLCYEGRIRRGDFDRAMRVADVVVTRTYTTQHIDHGFLEPHAAVAEPDGHGGVVVWITTKTVHTVRDQICKVLDLPEDKVRVIAATVGGSFGGKPDIVCGCLGGLGALKTGRPVKLVYSREDVFRNGLKRHPYTVTVSHAADRTGKILGVKVDLLADTGAYTADTKAAVSRGLIHAAGPYYVENVDIWGRAAYTNNPVTGALRGYGVPQINFVHETQMDLVAEKLGMDPVDLRLVNVLRPGQTTITGQVVPDGVGVEECLLRAKKLLSEKKESPYRGMGLACFYYGNGRTAVEDAGRCRLVRDASGDFTLYVGVPDVGQGSDTVLAQIACEELGIPWSRVKVVPGDSGLSPESGPTSATRVTVVVGRAVQNACRKMKELLAKEGPGVRKTLEVQAEFLTDTSSLDENGQGRPYMTYTYGVQVAEVEVDRDTGKVRVLKIHGIFDVGQVVNPVLFSAQIEGGALSGVGWALQEEVRLVEGNVKSPDFHTYLLPVAPDIPCMPFETVGSSDGAGPFGAKGIGEPASIPTTAAIGNAIADACGVRFLELPMTMEKTWWRLKEASGTPYEQRVSGGGLL